MDSTPSLRQLQLGICIAATMACARPAKADTPVADPAAYAGLTGNCMSEHHWDPGVQGNVTPTPEMFAHGVCKISFRADVNDCLRQSAASSANPITERRCTQQVLTGVGNLLRWNTVGPKLDVEP